MARKVELRSDPSVTFDPKDPTTWPAAYVDGRFACDTVVLDRVANSARRRRRLPEPADTSAVAPQLRWHSAAAASRLASLRFLDTCRDMPAESRLARRAHRRPRCVTVLAD